MLKPLLVALLIGLTLPAAADAAAGKAPICAVCGKAIAGDSVEADGQIMHRQCFVCSVCGKRIDGPYRTFAGRYVHDACWAEHYAPRCGVCGQPITANYVEADGRTFHHECFMCSVCGKRIEGSFVEHDGGYVHPICWEERYAPRCGVCGRPIVGEHRAFEGVSYHEACYVEHKAPVCLICGNRILGALVFDGWGQSIHGEHEGSTQVCSSCGRFAPPGQLVLLSDGRLQCAVCRRDAVSKKDQVRSLTQNVVDILAANGILLRTPAKRIKIKLVDRKRLRKLAPESPDAEGLYLYETENWYSGPTDNVTVEWRTIFVLSDLPADFFQGVAAHEVFHLWQHERHANYGPPTWKEGSAQVAADLVYQQLGSDLAKHHQRSMLKADDPVYGPGYREAKAFLEQHGIRAFLDVVVRRGSNPAR